MSSNSSSKRGRGHFAVEGVTIAEHDSIRFLFLWRQHIELHLNYMIVTFLCAPS